MMSDSGDTETGNTMPCAQDVTNPEVPGGQLALTWDDNEKKAGWSRRAGVESDAKRLPDQTPSWVAAYTVERTQ